MRRMSSELCRRLTDKQIIKYVLPVALLIGATAPAFAAEFYIVRGPDKKCQIVEKRPTTPPW